MSQSLPADAAVPADAPLPPPEAAPDKHWLAAVLPVALIAACGELGIAVLNNSALPVYLNKGLKIDTALLPVLIAPFFLSELLKTPLGVLSDRYGRKPLILGGAAVTVFTPILFIHLHYHPYTAYAIAVLVAFGVLRLLDGAGQASLWPALYAYVGDVIAEKKRGAAMSVLNAVYMVALAVSFLIGGFVDDTFGPLLTHDPGITLRGQVSGVAHRMGRNMRQAGHGFAERLHHPLAHHPLAVTPASPPDVVVNPVFQPAHYFPSFYLTSILFACAAVVAGLALRDYIPRAREHTGESDAGHQITWQSFLASVRLVPQYLGLAFVTFFGIGCVALLIKIFAIDEFGLSEQQFGTLFLGPALLIGAVAVPAGHLADKWGKVRSVRAGFFLCALGLWGIPLLHHLHKVQATSFIAAAAAIGVGFVMAFPAWLALLTSLSGERQRGTVFGVVSTAQGVGMLLGALVGSTLYSHVSPIAPFVAAASLVSLGAIIALIFIREPPLAPRKTQPAPAP